MAVKVITKKKEVAEEKLNSSVSLLPKVPRISSPPQRTENIIIRIIKVMFMDVRLLIDKKYRDDYTDYTNFCDLARGKY
jgi:hypothetical protein